MAGYECPAELRALEKMLKGFCYQYGLNISNVFDDWLFFILGNFNLKPKPEPGWKYTQEQNIQFHKMFVEWIQIMERQINRLEWYDTFGELYESCVASAGRRNNTGQFFTPANVCDLMTEINGVGDRPVGKNVSDPTCGSGRTLLSFHAQYPGNFMYAEDIDRTCSMMTVANFLIHGAVGEVIWHDSLWPDSWNGGWKVNEFLNNPLSPYCGIPHMREIGKAESMIMRYWENRAKEVADERQRKGQQITLPVTAGKPTQLTLW